MAEIAVIVASATFGAAIVGYGAGIAMARLVGWLDSRRKS